LYLSTAVIAFASLVEICGATLRARGVRLPQWSGLLPGTKTRRPFHGVILATGVAALVVAVSVLAARLDLTRIIPNPVHRDLVRVVLGQSSVDEYLGSHREGYTLYRYIAAHDLRMVFQPFDNGAADFAAAYNGGQDGKWILPSSTVPSEGESID